MATVLTSAQSIAFPICGVIFGITLSGFPRVWARGWDIPSYWDRDKPTGLGALIGLNYRETAWVFWRERYRGGPYYSVWLYNAAELDYRIGGFLLPAGARVCFFEGDFCTPPAAKTT